MSKLHEKLAGLEQHFEKMQALDAGKSEHHAGNAEENRHLAKLHKGTAHEKHYLNKAEHEDGLSESCAASAESHGAVRECVKSLADELGKALAGNLNKLAPTNVSVVTPDHPKFRMVPRNGMVVGGGEAPVSLEMEKIFGNLDDRDTVGPTIVPRS